MPAADGLVILEDLEFAQPAKSTQRGSINFFGGGVGSVNFFSAKSWFSSTKSRLSTALRDSDAEVVRLQLAETLSRFEEERVRAVGQQYCIVSAIALGLALVGVGCYVASLTFFMFAWSWALYATSTLSLSLFLLVLAGAIRSNKGLDDLFYSRPLLSLTLTLLMIGLDAARGTYLLILAVVGLNQVAFVLVVVAKRCGCARWPWLTPARLMMNWLCLSMLSFASYWIAIAFGWRPRVSDTPRERYLFPGAVAGFCCLGMYESWVRYGHGAGVTVATFCEKYLLFSGLVDCARTIIEATYVPTEVSVWCGLASLGLAMPPTFVTLVGRHRVYEFVTSTFRPQLDDKERDGSFVAGLLDAAIAEVGEEYWIHFDKEDERVELPSARRHKTRRDGRRDRDYVWKLGTVKTLDSDGVTVRFFDRKSAVVQEHLCEVTNADCAWPELLPLAMQGLRFIELEDISEILLKVRKQETWMRGLSRRVRAGERVDVFISHSSHDKAAPRLRALELFSTRFAARNQKFPNFWLDKACFDARVGDALKVLPMCIMGCNHMLSLFGETYASRLWCMWELFTLVAFCGVEGAVAKLTLTPLKYRRTNGARQQLRDVEILRGRCFDPNERRRLFDVIKTFGTEAFSTRLRALADATKEDFLFKTMLMGPAGGRSMLMGPGSVSQMQLHSDSGGYSSAGAGGSRSVVAAARRDSTSDAVAPSMRRPCSPGRGWGGPRILRQQMTAYRASGAEDSDSSEPCSPRRDVSSSSSECSVPLLLSSPIHTIVSRELFGLNPSTEMSI